MENNGFERFSKAWKKSGLAGFSKKLVSEKDIKEFKMKKSKDFSRGLNNSIIFDFVHKSLLIAAMLLLIWFYRADVSLVVIFIGLIGISIFQLFKENGIKNEFQTIDDYTKELSTTITQKLNFYRAHFPILRVMLAFTNALLVWVGSLFYFYSKYGYYRVDDIIDILVNVGMIGLAFGISYFALTYQYRFNILELEENLADLDDEVVAAIHIETQKRRKKRFLIGLTILTTIGLLLFIYLVVMYMKQVA